MNKRTLVKFVDQLLLKLLRSSHIRQLFQRNMMIRNMGRTSTSKQPRVLICYLTEPFYYKEDNVNGHPKHLQMMEMAHYFSSRGYAVDICNYIDAASIDESRHYDVIIGQGSSYLKALRAGNFKKAILFLTENNTDTVNQNYSERLKYFKERHPSVDANLSVERKGVFTLEHIQSSTDIIAFNSTNSAQSLLDHCRNVFPITVNTIGNKYANVPSEIIVRNKYNFVWLGSVGFIHKGLDILLDAFRDLPNYTLNVYGVPKSEMKLWKELSGPNTVLHPNIDVASERFVEEVIKQNAFVISTSCSEGIQTGVATCMRSGLIPIVTRDCGYDDHDSIFMLENYDVEYVKNRIQEICSTDDNVLVEMSSLARDYANSKFTNEQFTIELNEALDKILS